MVELNILDTATRSGSFQTFIQLLRGSDLEKRLRGNGFYTLFAPVDVSFAYLPPATLNHLLRAENLGILSEILGYHAIEQKILSSELSKLSKAKTICGLEIAFTNHTGLRVDYARVLHSDIVARNGVIHGIDRLLMPSIMGASASTQRH